MGKTKLNKELDNLNVWSECSIQIINESTMKWETVGTCPYTPNAIKAVMVTHHLKFAWVKSLLGREPYHLD